MAGAFCLSEPEAGSDPASLKTVARRDGDDYVLSGSKCWITSGDQAGVLLVMAKTDVEAGTKGISAFLVEPHMAGFSVGRHEEKMGLRASSTVTINLDEVRLPAAARIGPEGVGFKIAMRALDGGRIGIGSQALGIGLRAVEAATTFLRGQASVTSEAKAKLAHAATELEAARLLVLRAATMKDAGVPFGKEASMAKLYATEAANRACQRAVEILGPEGWTDRWPVERCFRDVRVTTIYEGTSEVQRIVIARQVLA
jgi:alkylation response protein AidB-like acyl-CoA dehydrogenase